MSMKPDLPPPPPLPAAPAVPAKPHSFTIHGTRITDDYAWLKADNWREVLKDPAALDPAIRTALERENAYTAAVFAGTEAFQKTLVAEMRGPHQGGRFLGARTGRAVFLFHPLPRGRPASADLPRSAGRPCGSHPGRCATRRRKARPSSISAAPIIRPTTGSWPGAPTSRARNISPSGSATSRPARIRRMRSPARPGAWSGSGIRADSTTSSSTTTTGRSA